MTRVTENISPTATAGVTRKATASLPSLLLGVALSAFGVVFAGGCDTPLDDLNMMNTPRNESGEESDFFADGRADRNQVANTIGVGQLVTDDNRLLRTGRQDGKPSEVYPFEITKFDLERGRQRYDIYCAVCHNQTGDGQGMIVKRGFVPPPSLILGVGPQNPSSLDQRTKDLQNTTPGHIFEVISNGWGAMYSYNDRIPVEDRWRIAAYVKVLQMSQSADVTTLPAEVKGYVDDAVKNPYGPKKEAPAPSGHGAAPAGHGGAQ